jgi:DNA repair protein RadA/Sms
MNNKDQYINLTEVIKTDDIRVKTDIKELDYILGGGLAKGELILLAGEPGSGKSTFILQLCHIFAHKDQKILYACGEESLGQVKGRADRVKSTHPYISVTEAMALEQLIIMINEFNPDIFVLDSLQMIYTNALKQPSGSPTQMRQCLLALSDLCRQKGITLIAIGHSTKSGAVAGLQTLQHMVDVVFVIEIDVNTARKLIAKKNRFGPAQTGIELRMEKTGFRELHTQGIFGDTHEVPTEEEPKGIFAKTKNGISWQFNRKTFLYTITQVISFIIMLPFAIIAGVIHGAFRQGKT